MPLYVTRPPDPSPGADWQAAVPGQYLYDITGITATLDALGGADLPTDISGNGNNGMYIPVADPSNFFTGAVTGNLALNMGPLVGPPSQIGWQMSAAATPLVGDCSVVFWRLMNFSDPGAETFTAYDALNNPVATIQVSAGGKLQWAASGGNAQAQTAAAVFPINGTWHLCGFSYDSGTGRITIYMDGVARALGVDVSGDPAGDVVDYSSFGLDSAPAVSAHGGVDEFAYFDSTLDAADHAAIYAARGNSAGYEATVLALNPTTYYRLDGALTPTTGRQITLEVTDGSDTVVEIPTGFAIGTGISPFSYSWQPRLASSSRSTDGTLYTVAIPKLILPAGYTVGPRTIDIGVADQWSDIAIWWDSSLMDAINGAGVYEYPPGAHLVYQQVPDG